MPNLAEVYIALLEPVQAIAATFPIVCCRASIETGVNARRQLSSIRPSHRATLFRATSSLCSRNAPVGGLLKDLEDVSVDLLATAAQIADTNEEITAGVRNTPFMSLSARIRNGKTYDTSDWLPGRKAGALGSHPPSNS